MTKTAKNTETRPCRCSIYSAIVEEVTNEHGEFVDLIEETTGCTATTKNDFAQGHDAKLKSHLITWGVLGYDVSRIEGGMRITNSALGQANEYAFAYMVAEGIAKGIAKREAAQKRADAKHEAQAAKAQAKAAKDKKNLTVTPMGVNLAKAPVDKLADAKITVTHAPAPKAEAVVDVVPAGKVKAKVGRWTYEGVIVDDHFHYTSKLGQAKKTRQFILMGI